MITTWDDLLKLLHIDERNLSSNDIAKLQQWCHEYISQEKAFSGDPKEIFADLKEYLCLFFENLGMFISGELSEKHSSLRNMSMIQFAAFKGYDQFLKSVLGTIQNTSKVLNDQTDAGMTALHFSTLNGHINTSILLLELGAGITIKNRMQQTPFFTTLVVPSRSTQELKDNKERLFNQLVHMFPDINLLDLDDISGTSIAHLAAQNGFTETLLGLIANNSNWLKKVDNFHMPLLQTAILCKQIDTAIALTKYPELLDLKDKDGRKPLHYAAMYGPKVLISKCTRQKIDELDHYSRTPLHLAASAGQLENVKFLIREGANVSLQDNQGFNVLHHAIESGNKELVRWLVENTEAQLNQIDLMGRSPLIVLLNNHSTISPDIGRLVSLFVDKGTDLSTPDHSGKSAKTYMQRLSFDIHDSEPSHDKRHVIK